MYSIRCKKIIIMNYEVTNNTSTAVLYLSTLTPDGAYLIIGICATIGLFGIFTNGPAIVIIFCYTQTWQETKFYLLINQILADFISSLFIATQFFSVLNGDPTSSAFTIEVTNDVLCRWWYSKSLMWAVINSSNSNIVLLTLERYMKIIHPWAYDRIWTRVSTVYNNVIYKLIANFPVN